MSKDKIEDIFFSKMSEDKIEDIITNSSLGRVIVFVRDQKREIINYLDPLSYTNNENFSLTYIFQWFNDVKSIKIKCDIENCKAKCCNYFIPIQYSEYTNFSSYSKFDNELKENILAKECDDAPCNFLDEKKSCEIYDNRPLICRIHPLGLVRRLYVSKETYFIQNWITPIFKTCSAVIEKLDKPDIESINLENNIIDLALSDVKELIESIRIQFLNKSNTK